MIDSAMARCLLKRSYDLSRISFSLPDRIARTGTGLESDRKGLVPRREEKIAAEPGGMSVKNVGGSGPGIGGSWIWSSSTVSRPEAILKI